MENVRTELRLRPIVARTEKRAGKMNQASWKPSAWKFLRAARRTLVAQFKLHPDQKLKYVIETAIFFLTAWLRPRVSEQIYRAREAECKTCPIYDQEYETCGLPPVGCGCHQVTRAKLQVNCWLYTKTNGKEGWPSELNSFPLGDHS